MIYHKMCTVRTRRPLVDLQSGSLKVKENNASHVAVTALNGYSFVKNFKQNCADYLKCIWH